MTVPKWIQPAVAPLVVLLIAFLCQQVFCRAQYLARFNEKCAEKAAALLIAPYMRLPHITDSDTSDLFERTARFAYEQQAGKGAGNFVCTCNCLSPFSPIAVRLQ